MQWRTNQMCSWNSQCPTSMWGECWGEARCEAVINPVPGQLQSSTDQYWDHQRYTIRMSTNDRPRVQRKPQLSAGESIECDCYPCSRPSSYQKHKVRDEGSWMEVSPNYSVIQTITFQGGERDKAVHALTHQVIWPETSTFEKNICL